MLFRRILVPAVSPRLVHALEGLLPKLVKKDGEVTLLNVINLPRTRLHAYADEKLEEAERLLSDLSPGVETSGASVKSKIMVGRSEAAAIVHEARVGRHDLILLGWTGRDRGERLLFGNLIDDVVRSADTNVMMADYKSKSAFDASRVLLPTAGYDDSVLASQVAAALAKPARGPGGPRGYPRGAAIESDGESRVTLLHASPKGAPEGKAKAALRASGMILDADGVKYREAVVEARDPARAILAHARRERSTMLILGASRRPRAHRFLWGSTVDRVLKKTTCPSLVVKIGRSGGTN